MSERAWPACPECGSEDTTVLHEAAPEATASHATLKCEACGRIFRGVLVTPKPHEVACVVSEGSESRRTRVQVPSGTPLRVGDEVFSDGHRLLVTGIETNDLRRVNTARPTSVKTVWCKVFDTVEVGVAVNIRQTTVTANLRVSPEEEFFVGDRITVSIGPVEVHAIKTADGMRYRGGANAREIVRLYARPYDPDRPPERKEKAKPARGRGR